MAILPKCVSIKPVIDGQLLISTFLEIAMCPAKSKAQQKFMAGCANNPSKMGKKCPPKEVAKEFAHMPKRTKSRGRG